MIILVVTDCSQVSEPVQPVLAVYGEFKEGSGRSLTGQVPLGKISARWVTPLVREAAMLLVCVPVCTRGTSAYQNQHTSAVLPAQRGNQSVRGTHQIQIQTEKENKKNNNKNTRIRETEAERRGDTTYAPGARMHTHIHTHTLHMRTHTHCTRTCSHAQTPLSAHTMYSW